MMEPDDFHRQWQKRGMPSPLQGIAPRRNSWLSLARPDYFSPLRFALSLVFVMLWIFDGVTAMVAYGEAGAAFEMNPVMRWLLDWSGLFGFAVVKSVVLVFWLYAAPYMRLWLVLLVLGLMVPVTAANVAMLVVL